MKTSILVALAAISLVGVGIFSAAVLAAPHTTATSPQGGMQGGYRGGMMNGGNGMMGGGGCACLNNADCPEYMYDHNSRWDQNDSWGHGGMMG